MVGDGARSMVAGDSLLLHMGATSIQRIFAPVKRFTPEWLSGAIRSVGTAALTPLYFSARSGHFKSSFKRAAVTPRGDPLPWYTFPCIDFLRQRKFAGRSVLEFGGGQSSTARVRSVIWRTLGAINSIDCGAGFVANRSRFVHEPLADRPAPVSALIPVSRVKKSAGTWLSPGLLLESGANRSTFARYGTIDIHRADLSITDAVRDMGG